MDKALLSLHVLAAIIFIGPVTVAVSLFPRYARLALTRHALAVHRLSHRAGTSGVDASDIQDDEARREDRPSAAADAGAEPVARLLHRICRVYAVLGLSVPVLGIALAAQLGVLGEIWLLTSMVLTLLAALLLAAMVLPVQARAVAVLDADGDGDGDGDEFAISAAVTEWFAGAKRLAMFSGVFALLWTAVVVLMVVRPGSTTGV